MLRRLRARRLVLTLGAAAAALVLVTPAASNIIAVGGGAIGVSVTGLASLSPTPSVPLPPGGGGPFTATAASVNLLGVLTTGVLAVGTQGSLGATGSAQSSSTVQNVNVPIGFPALVTAQVVQTSCTSQTSGSTGSTALTNAFVAGVPVSASPTLNTTITVIGVATVVLNQQTGSPGPGTTTSITVNGIHVTLLDQTEDIIIAQSQCSATGQPSAVLVRSFRAQETPKGILLRWRTGTESHTLGFNVYRQAGRQAVRLNRMLIAARGLAGGAVYSRLDGKAPAGPVVRYRLQRVATSGQTSWVASALLVR
jgi:hypothetical protein